ncbi:MAG TPA: NADH-quinone oxidoreductase subunit N [Solirubrobacterales bacterium]|nr:NADH-quinone oxidoreductase subunit N [Solirubrobacterales bacterium]
MNELNAPTIDYAGLSPLIALTAGTCLTLLMGLFPRNVGRVLSVTTALLTLATAFGLSVWQFGDPKSLVEGALRSDDLALSLNFVFFTAAAVALVLSLRERPVPTTSLADYSALLLASVTGMVVLAAATNLVTLFLGIELLSIPLYVMCALDLHRRTSLESGLKYLVIGSVGSATLLYGLAFIYGATGSTDFGRIAVSMSESGITGDPLLLTGIALALTGLAFKASVAPFHQWTPDVYEGAPTSVTTFMAVATKAAAFAILLRFFDVALYPARDDWEIALAALAVVTIVVGNVGAIGQDSLKRMLAYSGVAQAGYMLAGVVVASELGVKATVFYLFVYLFMNVAAFAVVIARERETTFGDRIEAVAGIGASRPVLAWTLTISMLGLAGLPGTAGFLGKFFLIEASVDGGFTWLGIAIAVGSMLSLVYYLRVIAAVWMGPATAPVPALAGGAPEADPAVPRPSRAAVETTAVACVAAAATVFFGIIPSPLLDVAADAGRALGLG